jgi:hypothetical protein
MLAGARILYGLQRLCPETPRVMQARRGQFHDRCGKCFSGFLVQRPVDWVWIDADLSARLIVGLLKDL